MCHEMEQIYSEGVSLSAQEVKKWRDESVSGQQSRLVK